MVPSLFEPLKFYCISIVAVVSHYLSFQLVVELQSLEQVWNHENMFDIMSVNHSARSRGIIGIFFRFSLTLRYIMCSH